MTGVSPKNPTDYRGPSLYNIVGVTRKRRPTGADVFQPENGKYYTISTVWQVGKNPTTGVEGELWFLSKIVANVSYWIFLGGGFPPVVGPIVGVTVDAATGPGTNPVLPTVTGLITVTGAQVAAGTIGANVIRTDSLAANAFRIEIQRSAAVASTASLNNGVSHFFNGQFSVDSNGFVQLVGGSAPAAQKFDVQAATAPGVDPVTPDGSGVVIVNGTIVAAHSIPLRSNTLALNTINIETQYTSAAATSVANNAGMASFDSSRFSVDANGYVSTPPSAVQFSNLGISYSGGTFTVKGANGSDLSTTNVAFVTIPSNTAGQSVTIPITNNYQFTDAAGTGDISGNSWGTSSGAWGNAMPFFLYAVLKTTNDHVEFAITRVPHISASPAAGSIAIKGSAVANTQAKLYLLDEIIAGTPTAPVAANYASSPMVYIGCFRMTKASVHNWVVTALASIDGVGRDYDPYYFQMPLGQNGAAAGSYFNSTVGGDTLPVQTLGAWNYKLKRDGFCWASWGFGTITLGVGTGDLQIMFPIAVDYVQTQTILAQGQHRDSGTGLFDTFKIMTPGVAYPTYIGYFLREGTGTSLYTVTTMPATTIFGTFFGVYPIGNA